MESIIFFILLTFYIKIMLQFLQFKFKRFTTMELCSKCYWYLSFVLAMIFNY